MATEVAEILRGVGAQQVEVDDDARLFGFFDGGAGRYYIFGQGIQRCVSLSDKFNRARGAEKRRPIRRELSELRHRAREIKDG